MRLEVSAIETFECIKEISYVAGFVLRDWSKSIGGGGPEQRGGGS